MTLYISVDFLCHMFFYKRENKTSFNVWPCFVDALSSLLIIFIFIVMGFLVSQIYLSKELNNSDSCLKNLRENLSVMYNHINDINVKNIELEKILKLKIGKILELENMLKTSEEFSSKIQSENIDLNEQLSKLSENIKSLNYLLETEKKKSIESEEKIKFEMNNIISSKVAELEKLRDELRSLKSQIPQQILQNPELLKYRSEFFATLQNLIGDRSDIRTVGDRFVFQSEVLFAQGSDKLEAKGKEVLKKLAFVLKEIELKMPPYFNWVLMVDGHSDKIPIHNDKFSSNWDLSSARAVRVVKYLIKQGISPHHLSSAGFAEYFPITTDPSKMAKNRRIELRLDQR